MSIEKQHSIKKRVLCTAMAAALTVTAFAGIGTVAIATEEVSAAKYELADNIQDGTILHCFDWKYTDIKDELENIAKAGFSSIQTSPAQASEGLGTWYWLYQPLGFSIQENELGTKEELEDLCKEAEKYGIKVIVDVVANHLASNHENIQDDLKPDQYWHTLGEIKSYNDRNQVINGDIGMTDLKSEDPYVQSVVADYVKELKAVGVDGIRWDAAKHIGLPSEGCDFWKTVTKEGLYNYGEILIGPTDKGSEDLMVEYTDYMSVTDSAYATSLVGAFKTGKAPATDGNWVNRGVEADKLVYWGESHDTYSNAEGKETNGVAQNIIDRAYAVAASRSDVSALYLSRPFATARDSIRIGVKGSTHFTSPEVAAVNHFHNAMIGKEDFYTTADNCSVITRKGGGAVIVMGDGSGEVSVPNGGGYAVPGTYKDEVTGNEFTVTDTTITGKVGSSGIAVIYDSHFLSRVSAEPSDTAFTSDTLSVTLHSQEVTDAKYETSEGASGTFADGDTIDIGAVSSAGDVITLKLTAIGADGDEVTAAYKYTKEAARILPTLKKGGVVFDNSITNWKTVNVYVYDEITLAPKTITNAAWPGVKMTECGDGYYSYELPEQFAECKNIMIIFNNGAGDQIPGAMQEGLTMSYADKKLYNGTKWLDLPDDGDKTSSSSSSSSAASSTSSVSSDPSSSAPSSSVPESSGSGVSSKQSSTSSTGSSAGSNAASSKASVASAASAVSSASSSSTASDLLAVATSDSSMFIAAVIAMIGAVSALVVVMSSKKKREQ